MSIIAKACIIGISNMNLIRFNVASLRASNREGVHYKVIQHASEHGVSNTSTESIFVNGQKRTSGSV